MKDVNNVNQGKTGKNDNVKTVKSKNKYKIWLVTIIIMSFALSALSGFFAQLVTGEKDLLLSVLFVIFMILTSICFDGIGVAVTSCNSNVRVNKYHNNYKWLMRNAEKVNNVCCDVVGDMCGVLCGASGAVIVTCINLALGNDKYTYLFSIIISGLIACITIGGKAIMKSVAIKYSNNIIMLMAKMIYGLKLKK